jgi:gamma-glutamyltranspeptidase/glutathione hydrolase
MPLLVYDRGGQLCAAAGTMGGDGQPQVLAQVISRALWGGEATAEAVAAPRLLHGRFVVGEPDDVVHIEDTLDPEIVDALLADGHTVTSHPWPSQRMGHTCLITADRSSPWRTAASDPRSDGAALAV